MKTSRLKLLFELAMELYTEEQKNSGLETPIPYAFARDEHGQAIVVSCWAVHSITLFEKIEGMENATVVTAEGRY